MEIVNLAGALLKAQSEMPALVKDKTASAKQFSYDYLSLSSLLNIVQPVLANNELTVSQPVTSSEDGRMVGVKTILAHSSGETLESTVFLPVSFEGNYLQEAGKIITYLRRYSIVSILGLSPDDDDDGTGVGGSEKAKTSNRTRNTQSKNNAGSGRSGGAKANSGRNQQPEPQEDSEGKKIQRPMPPEVLYDALDRKAKHLHPASEKQVNFTAILLKEYCAGDEDLRRALQENLTGGVAHLSDAEPKTVNAILKWLDPQKNPDGSGFYLPEVVKKELGLIRAQMPVSPHN